MDYIIATGLENAVSQLDELGVRWDQIDFYGHGVDGRQKMGRTLYPDDYGAFRPYLNDGSSINFMGCDTAGGDNPEGIIQMTADYSGATVTGYKGKYHYMFNIRLYSPFDCWSQKHHPAPQRTMMQCNEKIHFDFVFGGVSGSGCFIADPLPGFISTGGVDEFIGCCILQKEYPKKCYWISNTQMRLQ